MKRSWTRKPIEFWILALGLLGAIGLVWASTVVGAGADWAGRLALDQAASEWTEIVQREWASFDIAEAPGRKIVRYQAADLDVLAGNPTSDSQSLFGVLLREARRVARFGGADVKTALQLADAAAATRQEREVMQLAWLQAALANQDFEVVRELWGGLRASMQHAGPLARDEGVPVCVLATLALAAHLTTEERREAADALAMACALEVFPLGRGPRDFAGAEGHLTALEGALQMELPAIRAQLERRVELWDWLVSVGGPDVLQREAAWRAVLSQPSEALIGLSDIIGSGEGQVPGPDFGLRVRRATSVAESTLVEWEVIAARRAAILSAFAERLQANPTWDTDLRIVDTEGPLKGTLAFASASRDERVRASIPLGAGWIRVDLEHSDAAGFIAAQGQSNRVLRWGLLGLGAGFLVVAWLVSGALRKQRQLAALKSEFIAKVSHELRTPVAGILLAAEGLDEARAPSPERRVRYAGLIHREARRLERLVANVLDFSRIERGRLDWLKLEPQPVAEALSWIVTHVKEHMDGRAVEFDVCDVELGPWHSRSIAGGADVLRWDREALGRALLNLIDNAVAHGGGAHVRLLVDVASHAEARELLLAVEDDGFGIAPNQAAKVFDAFHQAPLAHASNQMPHKGAGLGLSIVREIVLGHDGTLLLETASSGRLARFVLRLPLQRPRAVASMPPSTHLPDTERPRA